MIQSSQDFFWVIFGLSIALFTVVLTFAVFYVVLILRNANKVFTSVREKMELVDKILKLVKDKLEKGSSHMAMLADTAIKLSGYVMDKRSSKGSGKKK